METLDDILETAHVDGVVVLVDKDADYAYAHTVGLGRTLLSPINKDNIELGTWLSLTITQNKDAVLVSNKSIIRRFNLLYFEHFIGFKVSSIDAAGKLFYVSRFGALRIQVTPYKCCSGSSHPVSGLLYVSLVPVKDSLRASIVV